MNDEQPGADQSGGADEHGQPGSSQAASGSGEQGYEGAGVQEGGGYQRSEEGGGGYERSGKHDEDYDPREEGARNQGAGGTDDEGAGEE
jgi:hypothetical protein